MRGSLARTLDLLALFFAVVPGVVSLAGISAGPALLLMRILAIACTLIVIVRFAHRHLVRRNRELGARISRLTRENRVLSAARDEAAAALTDIWQSIIRLAEAQTLLHKDRVTIRITIGDDRDGDEVL